MTEPLLQLQSQNLKNLCVTVAMCCAADSLIGAN